MTKGEKVIQNWFKAKGWQMADFQKESADAYLAGMSGLVNAPTGSGKTYSLFIPILIDYINKNKDYQTRTNGKLQILWITPLRALTKDIQRNLQLACDELLIPWRIGIRTGDMTAKEKTLQKKSMPEVLLITPESLHLLFTQKNHAEIFNRLQSIVVDEWHELLGTKRGVHTELALSRLRKIKPDLLTWGMSATMGNMEEALQVLVGINHPADKMTIIRSKKKKQVRVESILPDKIERMPWAGYLGINLLDKVMPIIMQSTTTLLFTNTRSHTEIWYRFIAEKYPELAGLVALHHGSLDREIRTWVEENLHAEKLKLVICTSSLDLGVDFRPVETVIQVGSPKSIARFLQRAGRSGHRPGAVSKIYFVPTHALELLEGVSLRKGVENNEMESRVPIVQAFDVLIQYMVTMAVGDGFEEKELFEEVRQTNAYQYLNRQEWEWMLRLITTGGPSMVAYDEFKKVEVENGIFQVNSRKVAMRHRLSMGTIVSESHMRVKYVTGKDLGVIEEYFISRLKIGDVFVFAGLTLELVRVRDMMAYVRKSSSMKGIVPRWAGGRIPLSSQLSIFIRKQLENVLDKNQKEPELKRMQPLLALQDDRSAIPNQNQLLVEQCKTRDGFHIFIFPFEGRLVHEGMASLIAYRISRILPITFSLAMSDYGFELLSDKEVNLEELLEEHALFSTKNLLDDIQHSVNSNEMAKRKFREIASIAGMIFQGYPGQTVRTSHVQASSSLLFETFSDHEPDNLLVRQAFQESLDQQLEEQRLREALERIDGQEFIFKSMERPSPFAFPILVDRLRDEMTSEKLEDRVNKLLKQEPYFNGNTDKK